MASIREEEKAYKKLMKYEHPSTNRSLSKDIDSWMEGKPRYRAYIADAFKYGFCEYFYTPMEAVDEAIRKAEEARHGQDTRYAIEKHQE